MFLQRRAGQNSRNIFLLESEAGLSLGRTWDRFYSQAPHFHHNLYWSRAARGELTFPDKLVSLSLIANGPIRYATDAVAGWCWVRWKNHLQLELNCTRTGPGGRQVVTTRPRCGRSRGWTRTTG